MKKAKAVLLVGAILFGAYAVVMLIVNATTYASYVEYYGLGQVLPTILEGFFSNAGWAFALFGLAAIVDVLSKKEQGAGLAEEPECASEDESLADADELEYASAYEVYTGPKNADDFELESKAEAESEAAPEVESEPEPEAEGEPESEEKPAR